MTYFYHFAMTYFYHFVMTCFYHFVMTYFYHFVMTCFYHFVMTDSTDNHSGPEYVDMSPMKDEKREDDGMFT